MNGDYDYDEEDHYNSSRIDSRTTVAEVPENKPITPEEAKKLVISIELDPSDVALQVIPYVGKYILHSIKKEITQVTRDIAKEELHKRLELEIGTLLDTEMVSEYGTKRGKTLREDIHERIQQTLAARAPYSEMSVLDKMVHDIAEKEIKPHLREAGKKLVAENKKMFADALYEAIKKVVPTIQLK